MRVIFGSQDETMAVRSRYCIRSRKQTQFERPAVEFVSETIGGSPVDGHSVAKDYADDQDPFHCRRE
jgi:hypothetical protein